MNAAPLPEWVGNLTIIVMLVVSFAGMVFVNRRDRGPQ